MGWNQFGNGLIDFEFVYGIDFLEFQGSALIFFQQLFAGILVDILTDNAGTLIQEFVHGYFSYAICPAGNYCHFAF